MNHLRLITDVLRPRRDYRVRTDRRWRWARVLGWIVAALPWLALWSLWWLVQQ